jgi:PAS domain S-box-containing protein
MKNVILVFKESFVFRWCTLAILLLLILFGVFYGLSMASMSDIYHALAGLCATTIVLGIPMAFFTRAFVHKLEKRVNHLSLSESQLSLAQEEGDLGVWRWDTDHDTLSFNSQWMENFGVDPNKTSIRRDEWLEGVDPNEKEEVFHHFLNAMSTKDGSINIRYSYKSGDHWIWIHSIGRAISWSSEFIPSEIIGIHLNLSDRLLYERELKNFEMILSVSQEAILTVGLNFEILSINERTCQIFGYTQEELIRQPLSLILPTYGTSQLENQLIQLGMEPDKALLPVESNALTKDDKEIIVSMITAPIFGENGSIVQFSLSIRDVTEIAVARRTSYGLAEMRGKLVTTISRAIRDPLTILEQSLFLIDEQCAAHIDESTKELIAITKANLYKLNQLIHNVLDQQQLESGNLELNFSRGCINDNVKQVLKLLVVDLQTKNLSLEVNLDPDLPNSDYDSSKLDQVFMHVIDNAIKFTNQGTITVSSYISNKTIVLEVKDTGIGLQEEEKERIFYSFMQSHDMNFHPGGGMGLAYCKKILELHGGKISVTSQEGQGSTFFLELPKEQS